MITQIFPYFHFILHLGHRFVIPAYLPPAYRQAGGPDRGRGRQVCDQRFINFSEISISACSPSSNSLEFIPYG